MVDICTSVSRWAIGLPAILGETELLVHAPAPTRNKHRIQAPVTLQILRFMDILLSFISNIMHWR